MNSPSRKKKSVKRNDGASKNNASQEKTRHTLPILFSFFVSSLIFIQFLIPTESVVLGNRLWIPQLWMGMAVLTAFYYSQDFINLFKISKTGRYLDLFILLIVAGHVVSTLYLFSQQGNERAALNVMWEWVGLGASWVLIRIFLNSEQRWYSFRTLLISSLSSLALLGIYQHYISFPETVKEYQQLRTRLDEIEASADLQSPSIINQYQQTVTELTEMGAPLKGPARRVWEDRLTGSTEPLGFFALGNSFAGILLIGFFLTFQGFLNRFQQDKKGWFYLVLSLIIIFCLILTKSRTAFAGLLSGLLIWFAMSNGFRLKKENLKKILLGIFGGIIVLVGLLIVAQFSGGFDREVVSQATKSFQYRLQFWEGTMSVLKDSPLFGAGPGNFRQHYLKYKLPESSEEIGDPHNLFLDIWANGGIISLIGLIGICLTALFWFIQRFALNDESVIPEIKPAKTQEKSNENSLLFLFTGIFSFHLFVFLILFFIQSRIDSRILVVGLITASFTCSLRSHKVKLSESRSIILAGICAILVHLMGAGGIEMPAIVGIIFILFNFYQVDENRDTDLEPSKSIYLVIGLGSLFLLGFVTGLLPVNKASQSIAIGDYEIQYHGNFHQAELRYQESARQDPYSPTASTRLSELYYQQWIRNKKISLEWIDESIQSIKIAIDLNPLDSKAYHLAGMRYRQKFEVSHSIEDLNHSVKYLNTALERYPTEIQILIDLVKTYQLFSGQKKRKEARIHAEKALLLDQINHREGHIDKYLSEEIKNYLSEI